MTAADSEIRLFVYESARDGHIPAPRDVARQFSLTPQQAADSFRRLQEADALVLLPDSHYIWMAEPFSAVATDYPVVRGDRSWYGNCIWDALAIAVLVDGRCSIPTSCPQSGADLTVETEGEALVTGPGVVHFAVPSNRWWESIGFT